MNKLLFFTILLTCLCCTATAQLRVGVEAGLITNFTTSYKSNATDTDYGYKLGLMTSYKFKNKIYLETGIYYTRKNPRFYNLDPETFRITTDVSIIGGQGYTSFNAEQLGYLEIPILFGYVIPLSDKLSLTPKIGGYIAVGLNSSDALIEGSDNYGNEFMVRQDVFWQKYKYEVIDYRTFERTDIGLHFGLEFSYGPITLYPSFNYGLNNHYNLFSPQSSTRSFNLTLKYCFLIL